MAYAGLNLERIIASAITPIVPKRNIILNIFTGQVVDDAGATTVSYTAYPALAQVQLENAQNLAHLDSINMNQVFKRFYIQSSTLTGLNINLNTGGDYITMDGLFYKIISVVENFKVGWVQVVGAESTVINE